MVIRVALLDPFPILNSFLFRNSFWFYGEFLDAYLRSMLCHQRLITVWIIALYLLPAGSQSQIYCSDSAYYQPPDVAGIIHWAAFPEFHLPSFTIVYEGPRLGDPLQQPLAHGFSHIANQLDNTGPGDFTDLPPENRALTWYHVASCLGDQPWYYPCYSPWGNDTVAYKNEWNNRLGWYADMYADSFGDSLPHVDLLVADIESARINGFNDNADYIDSLYYHPEECSIPQEYLDGTTEEFVTHYEEDMMDLYAIPMAYAAHGMNENGYQTRLSAYGEGPVTTTYHKISHHSWEEWTTDESLVNYLIKDSIQELSAEAPFYSRCDFIAPHAYYIYDQDPYYLAYCLFQVEVNKAWSTKDLILYASLRYNSGEYITPSMAEATAIMPFMSGANGIWLWDHYYPEEVDTTHFINYDYFIRGLNRLSEYADFFVDGYSVYIPETAHSLFLSGDPVWRAVIQGPNILVAAQNPFAGDTDTTFIDLSYEGWSQQIALIGRQVFLCDFVWDPTLVYQPEEIHSIVFKYQPSIGEAVFSGNETLSYHLICSDVFGRAIYSGNFNGKLELDISNWPSGHYTYSAQAEDGITTGHWIK